MSPNGRDPATQVDVAYYYPAPYWGWRDGGWIKSLLLFFDQVSILLPGYMYGRHEAADPSLVIPMEERGLLEVLEPNEWIDQQMADQLAEVVVELLTNGTFDELPEASHFAELSQSRMGYGVDVGLASMLVEELQARGLARPSEDGVSIPLHPTVRTTILVILGQLSRTRRSRANLAIHPATNDFRAIGELLATLSQETLPSADSVIALDMEPVTFDLDPIPLDDVLAFRSEHQAAHKAYMRDLRRFMAELAAVDDEHAREQLLVERRQELADAAHSLQRETRCTLGKNLSSWGLGIAGSAWALTTGDPIGVALAAASLLPTMAGSSDTVTAYSYIFAANRSFGASDW